MFFGFGRKFNLRVLESYTSDKASLDLRIREAEGGKREVDKNGVKWNLRSGSWTS